MKKSKPDMLIRMAAICAGLLMFVFVLSLASCDGSSGKQVGGSFQKESPDPTHPNGTKVQTQAGDSMAILVLCDLSTSQDTATIGRMAENGANLISLMPEGSRIVFFPTEDNTMQSAIFGFWKIRPRRGSQKLSIQKETREAIENFPQILRKHFTEARSRIKDEQPRSCIWSNVEAKISWFDSYRRNYCRYMVIMSDMVEQCNSSPVGPLFMEKKRYKAKATQVESYSKDIFSKYQDLRIRCINSAVAYRAPNPKFMPTNEIRETWVKIFKKMGYKATLAYGSEFPENLPSECYGY